MIIYSIIPLETIFEGIERETEPTIEAEIDGILMQLQPTVRGQARIVRLLTPEPRHYLNPAYQPGELVMLQPASRASVSTAL